MTRKFYKAAPNVTVDYCGVWTLIYPVCCIRTAGQIVLPTYLRGHCAKSHSVDGHELAMTIEFWKASHRFQSKITNKLQSINIATVTAA